MALDISEVALLLFGLLLVAGLIGEYRESVKWKKWVKMFELFVIIGVAGELLADGAIFLFSAHLQTISDTEVAQLNKEAGDARRAAGEAERGAAEANQRAKALEVQGETLRRQNLELEIRLAHRHITKEQHDKFVKALEPYKGAAVDLVKLGDSEAADFANEIVAVLEDSGWNVGLELTGNMSPPRYNLMCSVNESSEAGKALALVLKSLPTAIVESNPKLALTAAIVVGLKPTP